MIAKDDMVKILKRWGQWQRTATNPKLSYAMSQYNSPLQKQRNVLPIYIDNKAEKLEQIILNHLNQQEKLILELTYVEQQINPIIADTLKCSIRNLIIMRNELIACLRGLYTCLGQ